MNRKNQYFTFIFILLLFACSKNNEVIDKPEIQLPTVPSFYKGMDLSAQMELESYNLDYKDENNNAVNLLDFVKTKGVNLVRLRLWHTPTDGQNTLVKVKLFALKLKQRNINFMLDIHYSDTWADPSHQTSPLAWQSMPLAQVKNEVYLYTKDVMNQLKNQGTLPIFVQIGNETDSGFLWNYGKVWNSFNSNWVNYADLVKQGILAVREVNGTNTKIILHHSSVENAQYFFNELVLYNIDYDIIGLSYYPQYNTKDLNVVQSKLNYLSNTFNKQVMIVEVSYPFSLGWQDNSNNVTGLSSQIIPDFPATPNGQKLFIEQISTIVKNVPNNKGVGFIYWAPDWIAFTGNEATSTSGSSWENQCLFDFDHKALPAFGVFGQ